MTSPVPVTGDYMIQTQFIKSKNALLNEDIVTARIVNTQPMSFDDWCEHLADGSTLTSADVSAVMKLISKRLPTILGLNTKVVCSSDGLTFRPKVTGSITQSELKAKLEAKKEAETDPEKAALIDVDRKLRTSDLATSDCTVSIAVDLPKSWSALFHQKAQLKRVAKTYVDTVSADTSTDDDSEDITVDTGGDSTSTGGGSTSGGTSGGGSTSGGASGSTGDDGTIGSGE